MPSSSIQSKSPDEADQRTLEDSQLTPTITPLGSRNVNFAALRSGDFDKLTHPINQATKRNDSLYRTARVTKNSSFFANESSSLSPRAGQFQNTKWLLNHPESNEGSQ